MGGLIGSNKSKKNYHFYTQFHETIERERNKNKIIIFCKEPITKLENNNFSETETNRKNNNICY